MFNNNFLLVDSGRVRVGYFRVFAVHNTHPLLFSIICTSAYGSVTTTTWTRDSEEIEGVITEWSHKTTYKHILTNTTEQGIYTCTVSNNLPSSSTATLNATGNLM